MHSSYFILSMRTVYCLMFYRVFLHAPLIILILRKLPCEIISFHCLKARRFVRLIHVFFCCFFQEVEHINLKVLGQDNAIVQFKIKKQTPLKKLMTAYCERVVSFSNLDSLMNHVEQPLFLSSCVFSQGLAIATVRFRFDGQAINETDTPSSLEMEEGDTIEVYQQQTGGRAHS